MNPAKDQILFEKYASLFPPKEIRDNETLSCLAFGFECDDGWFSLLDEALQAMADLNIPIQIDQVKEKFGGLRIYYHDGDERVDSIIKIAEEKASKTCERCGLPGEIKKIKNWYTCICPKCEKKRLKGE